MRILSFDIGIKNMALCFFDLSGSQIRLLEWRILDLMNIEPEQHRCGCLLKTGTKLCDKPAKFTKNGNFFCEKHAKLNKEFNILTKECSQISLRKMKIGELRQFCLDRAINAEVDTKKALLEFLEVYFLRTCFESLTTPKKTSANNIDLITIGKNMKRILNEIENLDNIDIVLIENQISPIANRMKTIQGMLAQYFIMKQDDVGIEFISSANKLKDFAYAEKKSYKENKKNGVLYCSQLLQSIFEFERWTPLLETKKKDDLADAFLQGMWYIKNKLNIMRST